MKGGLASATVVACTMLAAMVGVVGATEITMGMIALPAMLRRNYEPKLACGSLLAGGTLGILIPPSVMAIVYAVVAQQSLGELLIGSVFPGLPALRAVHRVHDDALLHQSRRSAPRCPSKSASSMREKLRLLRNTITPVLLIILVLGVIFLGIATPVEAAGIGSFGALRRLRAASPAQLGRDPRSRHVDAEGDRDGDVDLLRRDDVRRLLHRQGRPDVRHRT